MRNHYLALGACLFSSVYAATATAAELITLRQAIENTLAANPTLVASNFKLEAQTGELMQAGVRPRPELNVELENVAGGGDYSGADEAELTVSLSWLLERGKRDGRSRSAEAALSLAETDAEIARLDAASETARLYLDCVRNQELVELMAASVALEEESLQAIRTRVAKGRSPAADLAQAEVRLARQKLSREGYEHALQSALRRLAAQWGARDIGGRVQPLAMTVPPVREFAELQAQLVASPYVGRYLSEQRFQEAELALAELRSKVSWTVGAGVRRFESTNDNALVAHVTVPLGGGSANQGNVASARAAVASSKAGLRARQLELEARLYGVYQDYVHSLHRLEVLRAEVMPGIEKALAETRKAYAAGRYSYNNLRDAQDELLEVRNAVLIATLDANRSIIEIERLTGTVVSGESSQSEFADE